MGSAVTMMQLTDEWMDGWIERLNAWVDADLVCMRPRMGSACGCMGVP